MRNTFKKAFTYLAVCFVIASFTNCLSMRWIPPLTSMVMVYRHVQDLPNFNWVSEEHTSNNAFVAVIALAIYAFCGKSYTVTDCCS